MQDIFINKKKFSLTYIHNAVVDEMFPKFKSSYTPVKYSDQVVKMIPCVEVEDEPKPRGKKKKEEKNLPENIREYTLPDGSVVVIDTDKMEYEEESVIDSITK